MTTRRCRATVRATPERVLETLTDTDACARWSPVSFSLDDVEETRLRPGTTTGVSGRLLGARVRFALETIRADPTCLRLRARGPIVILVDYALRPVPDGCAVEAVVSVCPADERVGRMLTRATGLMLAGGTLDHAIARMAREAERSAAGEEPGAQREEPAEERHRQEGQPEPIPATPPSGRNGALEQAKRDVIGHGRHTTGRRSSLARPR
jgi:Polyketide cyclase / dehydrase and lipid transport